MLRPTLRRFPADEDNHSSKALPFGAVLTPLAPTPPPPSTFSPQSNHKPKNNSFIFATEASQLPRCDRCAAYISSKAPINARSWVCPLCRYSNSCPMEYSRIIVEGEEAKDRVPELSHSLYDIPVADGNPSNSIVPPVAYVFIVDVAGDMAYLDAARVAIRNALAVVEGQTLVGVVLYDQTAVSYLDTRDIPVLRSISLETECNSISTIFPPDQWLQPSGTNLTNAVIDALAKLSPPSSLTDNHSQEATSIKRPFGRAVSSVLDMLEASGLLASRVVAIAAGEPNTGAGALSVDTDIQQITKGLDEYQFSNGTKSNSVGQNHAKSTKLPSPLIPFYTEQGIRASELGVMFDLYFVTTMPLDVASLAPLAQISGGRLTLYENGEDTLSKDVWQHLNDPAVVRGLLRIRSSPEFVVSEVYGCGVYRDHEVRDVYRFGCHGHTSTLAADFAFTGRTSERYGSHSTHFLCIQVAFRGVFIEPGVLPQRVLRIETEKYATTTSLNTLRREADARAMTTLMFHRAIASADEQSVASARMLLFDWLSSLLATTAVLAQDDDSKIVIDATLQKHPQIQAVPRLVFGLIRSAIFRQQAVAQDARATLRCIWEDLSPSLLASAAYPTLTSFVNLHEIGELDLSLTVDAIHNCGHPIYMLDAFSEIIIYYAFPDRRDIAFPPPESSTIMRMCAERIRGRPVTPKCVFCREGTSKDRWFKSFLIEDAVTGAEAQSFSAFLEGAVDVAYEVLQQLPSDNVG